MARHGQGQQAATSGGPAIILNTKLSRAGATAARLEMRRYLYYRGTTLA